MKKKILLALVMVAAFVCLFAFSVSAANIYYNDASGNTLFMGVDENSDRIFESYTGSFPNTDDEGNALSWYITATEAVGDDTVHTVASFLTLDTTGEHASLSDAGAYKYVNQAKELSIVSAYFPNDKNILTLSLSDNGYGNAYSFDADKSNILFLTLPNTLTALPGRIAQATAIIDCTIDDSAPIQSYGVTVFYTAKNLRSVDIPAAVTVLRSNGHSNDGFPFYQCVSLVDVHFAPDSQLETIQQNSFNSCTALKEITIPNSVVNLEQRAFQACSSLETIRLGANAGKGLNAYNVQSLLYGCKSLKYVYMSDTMVPTAGSHLFNDGASGMVIFYTGDLAQYEALYGTLKTLGNNGKFINATPIAWDNTKDDQYYKDLAATDNKNYVVYDYDRCQAFYNGHQMSGDSTMQFNGYMNDITFASKCKNCTYTGIDETKTISAIFKYLGYSYTEGKFGGTYSMAQFFGVNEESLARYEEIIGATLSFGVIAKANVVEAGQAAGAISPSLDGEKVLYMDFTNGKNSYFEIKIAGIDAENLDTKIVFCAYVIENGKMFYLNNGETVEELTGESYNDVVAIMNAE